jgi:sugar (pentulose or hexulose) kinase
MKIYSVDLGTTNVKVALYDERLRRLALSSARMEYSRSGTQVQFDPDALLDTVVDLIARCARLASQTKDEDCVIAVTGQAESFVLLDRAGSVVRAGISWLDERSRDEAEEIEAAFGTSVLTERTGQPTSSPIWPAAKMLWLSRHEPQSLERTDQVLMVKDFLIYRLTGKSVGEVTTRGFGYFFDVSEGAYWPAMLDFCGIRREWLPPIVPAGTDVGLVHQPVLGTLPVATSWRVNAGTLDHFASMIGLNAYRPGTITESSGTVLSVTALLEGGVAPPQTVSFHRGIADRDLMAFSASDSGGVSLDWVTRELFGLNSSETVDGLLDSLDRGGVSGAPIFLPYLTGVNAPDYDPDARGAFLELTLSHDRASVALSVMEGVAHLLRLMIEPLTLSVRADAVLISSGGGSRSALWNQLKADVCGMPVVVPDEGEAGCRGVAMLALLAAGRFESLDELMDRHPLASVRYEPRASSITEERYARFLHYRARLFERSREG